MNVTGWGLVISAGDGNFIYRTNAFLSAYIVSSVGTFMISVFFRHLGIPLVIRSMNI